MAENNESEKILKVTLKADSEDFKKNIENARTEISETEKKLEHLQNKMKKIFNSSNSNRSSGTTTKKTSSPSVDSEGLYKDSQTPKTDKRITSENLLQLHKNENRNITGKKTKEFIAVEKEAEALQKKLFAIYDRIEKVNALSGFKKPEARLKSLEYDADTLEKKLKVVEEVMAGMERKGEKFEKVNSTYTRFGRISEVIRNSLNKTTNTFNKATKALKKVASFVKNILQHFANLTKKALNFFTTIKKCVPLLSKFEGLFSKIAKMFKTMILRKILKGLIGDMISAFNVLVRFSDDVNGRMTKMTTELSRLRYQIAAIAEPILNIIEPAVTRILSIAADGASKITQFISALTGKSTFTKAKKHIVDYRESLDGAADSAKNLKRQVMGFDEINSLSKDSSSDNNGNVNPYDVYETAPINGGIKGIADKIREQFKAGDWSGLGQTLGECVNNGIAKFDNFIKWDKHKKKITNGINGIAGVINSFTITFNGIKAGETIADGVETISNIFTQITTKIKFRKIGKKFADVADGMFSKDVWENFGSSIGNILMVIPNTVGGFINELKDKGTFKKFGKRLAGVFNGIFNSIDLDYIANSIVNLVNGLVDAFIEFFDNADYKGVAKSIGRGINTIITKTNWKNVFIALSDFAIAVLEGINAAIEELDFFEIGESIGEGLANINWIEVFKNLGKAIINAIAGIFKGLAGSIKGMFTESISGDDAFSKISNSMITLAAILAPVILSFIKLKGLFSSIPGISAGLSSAFGSLGSAGGTLASSVGCICPQFLLIAGAIAAAIAVGVLLYKNWDKIKEKAKSLKESVKKHFNNLKEDTCRSLHSIKEKATDVFNHLPNKMRTTITDSIKIAGKFHELGNKIRSALLKGLGKAFGIKITYDTQLTGMKKKIVNALGLVGMPKISWAANGGTFTKGQLFVANEAGPEMITSFDGKTAVSNNNQVRSTIFKAVNAAMLNAENRKQMYGGSENIDNTTIINVDGQTFARLMSKAKKQNDRRYNTVINV